jgi:para-aminobenzoate synthetase component 1
LQRHIAEIHFAPSDLKAVKDKMLSWASRFSISLFLDSNGYEDKYGSYECLLGAGAVHHVLDDDAKAFAAIQQARDERKDWLFGHLCYDLKNVLEPHLSSGHEARHHWPAMEFFVPEAVCIIPKGAPVLRVEALHGDADAIAAEILNEALAPPASLPQISFSSRFSKEEYMQRVAALKEHIRSGDCYEINFCNEAFSEGVAINARDVFRVLNAVSPAPFAAYYQCGTKHMMCASPERFITKQGDIIRSQPIKGTAGRSINAVEDEKLKAALRSSEKEQAENVMIVDLVRNDLARSCEVGSIEVEELYGIYSFPRVHQMISTVRGTLREEVPLADAVRYAFPMGSMTGAPKHKVMQLIDQYEAARRELFSGSVGYISPQGDFDFNVVIRSLFYNSESQYLSYQTGGAITWGSEPESEWEELRLKAAAMEQIFLKEA